MSENLRNVITENLRNVYVVVGHRSVLLHYQPPECIIVECALPFVVTMWRHFRVQYQVYPNLNLP